MITTEQDAKGRWCPFARVYGSHASTVNRTTKGTIHQDTLCLGSACMAWTWAGWKHDGKVHSREPHVSGGHAPAVGFCGMAPPARYEQI